MPYNLPRSSSTPPCLPPATTSNYPDDIYAHYFETPSEPTRELTVTTEETSLSGRELRLAQEFASWSRVLAWQRNLPDKDMSECEIGVPSLLDFRWPEPDHATTPPAMATVNPPDVGTDNATSEELLHSPVHGRQIGPSRAIRLYSLDDIDQESPLPPLVIGQDDVVGDRQLVVDRDGFLYPDPNIPSLVDVIAVRGFSTHPNDPNFETEAFYYEHVVRIFSQVPNIEEVEGIKEPQFEWIGNCYILKTSRYLCKEDWAKVNRRIKEFLITRRALASGTLPRGFGPDRLCTMCNLRNSPTHGNVFPLVFLRQAFCCRPQDYRVEGAPLVAPQNSPRDNVAFDSDQYESSDEGFESPNEVPKSDHGGMFRQVSSRRSSRYYTV